MNFDTRLSPKQNADYLEPVSQVTVTEERSIPEVKSVEVTPTIPENKDDHPFEISLDEVNQQRFEQINDLEKQIHTYQLGEDTNDQKLSPAKENHHNLIKLSLAAIPVLCFIMLVISLITITKLKKTSEKPASYPVDTEQVLTSPKPSLQAQNSDGFPLDKQMFTSGFKIGDIVIFVDDLTSAYDNLSVNTGTRNDQETWKKAVEMVNDYAIYQNEGVQLKLFEKGDGKLNYTQANQAKKYIEENQLKSLSLERVTIFFNNYIAPGVINPKIGVDKAKAQAFSVLTELKSKIDSGQYTMAEAGNALKAIPGLAEVDVAYKTNAYQKYEHLKPGDKVFDPNLLTSAWQMDKNQVSDILLSKDDTKEFYYTVIKITDKSTGEFDSLIEFLNKRKNDGLKISI